MNGRRISLKFASEAAFTLPPCATFYFFSARSVLHSLLPFRLNGEPFRVPEKGLYTTIANVDRAIEFIGEARAAKKPWFQYIAFNAPHAPLQPLEQDFKKHLGRYDVGWDKIRAARVAKQKQIGLLPFDTDESPRPQHIPKWSNWGDSTG
jgi:arylsulfatase A-like enzyme